MYPYSCLIKVSDGIFHVKVKINGVSFLLEREVNNGTTLIKDFGSSLDHKAGGKKKRIYEKEKKWEMLGIRDMHAKYGCSFCYFFW